jgi:Leucine-rich repeat (LRR) protein
MENGIKISPYGNMLLYQKGYTVEFVYNIIKKYHLSGLRIFDHLDRLETLDFLKDYVFLEKLDIDCIYDHDYSFLSSLTNLKFLGIGASIKQSNSIDLSNQKELETLGINWRKKITGLEKCTKLSSLTLVEFKEKDLQKIQDLKNLVELRIKTGAIENLSGADKLINLRSLNIGNCKKLHSIKAINHLPNLKELYLDICPNINDYEEVTDLPNLEALSLTDCGKVQSLKFIERYAALQKLSLLGNTVIVDGDLVPAKRIKSLEHKHYSHYNVKLENPSYNQNVKNNLEKIKNWFK